MLARSKIKGDPLKGFWVVTCYFNPCRYENRLRNLLAFARGLKEQGVKLMVVELAASDDEAHLRDGVGNKYVRVIQGDVLWAKEKLLNYGIKRLPRSCTKVCWADCDILWGRKDWAVATSVLLEDYAVIQPFATAIFLGPEETPEHHGRFRPSVAFARYYVQTAESHTLIHADDVLRGHPGYAWAARRSVLEEIGGLYDRAILGHGDLVMALAFSHNVTTDGEIPDGWSEHWDPGWSEKLKADVRAYQRRAAKVIQGSMVHANGTIYHLWHGPRRNRDYFKRGALLRDFDPAIHLEESETGMWRWTREAKLKGLPERALEYFKGRNEDDRTVL